MLNAYFNYPNGQITIHSKLGCASVRSHKKEGQRLIQIDSSNISTELHRINARDYKFASVAELNDLWLKVDLQDQDLELALVKHLHRHLSKYYKPFATAVIECHC